MPDVNPNLSPECGGKGEPACPPQPADKPIEQPQPIPEEGDGEAEVDE